MGINNGDIFGWSYNIMIDKYYELSTEINEFIEFMDKELNCDGCGFMLAFFSLSKKELDEFQKHYGYFPYDAYLGLWEKYTGKSQSYNQRNRCLDLLVKKKMIKAKYLNMRNQIYESSNNPFEKIINRNRNLKTLIGD